MLSANDNGRGRAIADWIETMPARTPFYDRAAFYELFPDATVEEMSEAEYMLYMRYTTRSAHLKNYDAMLKGADHVG